MLVHDAQALRDLRWPPTPTLFAAPGISASPSEDNLRYFDIMIAGPSSSPYEGAWRV